MAAVIGAAVVIVISLIGATWLLASLIYGARADIRGLQQVHEDLKYDVNRRLSSLEARIGGRRERDHSN